MATYSTTTFRLEVDQTSLRTGLMSAQRRIDGTATTVNKRFAGLGKSIATGLGRAAVTGIAAAGAGIAAMGTLSVKAAMEAEAANAQTVAALKSTHGAANVTKKGIQDLAGAIMGYSGMSDEAIQQGENLLLTFTNIRNETGKGNKVFDQSTKIMADMSVALGQDMKSSAMQLGKALNDPIKGMTALRRVGVTFTEEQEKVITKLQESGDVMGAQKVILAELRKEFGGSAKAAGDTFGGQLNILKEKVGNVLEVIGKSLIPILEKLANRLTKFVDSDKFKAWLADVRVWIKDFGEKVVAYAPKIIDFFTETVPKISRTAVAMGKFVAEHGGLMKMVAAFVALRKATNMLGLASLSRGLTGVTGALIGRGAGGAAVTAGIGASQGLLGALSAVGLATYMAHNKLKTLNATVAETRERLSSKVPSQETAATLDKGTDALGEMRSAQSGGFFLDLSNDTRTVTEDFKQWADQIGLTKNGLKRYVEVTKDSVGMTHDQEEQIAELIASFPKLGGRLDAHTRFTVTNALKVGDQNKALELLRERLRDTIPVYRNTTDMTDAYGQKVAWAKGQATDAHESIARSAGDMRDRVANHLLDMARDQVSAKEKAATNWGAIGDKMKSGSIGAMQSILQKHGIFLRNFSANANVLRTALSISKLEADYFSAKGLTGAYAKGGAVPGRGNRDSELALLTPGEHVWTKDEVQKMGGHQVMEAMRSQVQKFAKGGQVGKMTDGSSVLGRIVQLIAPVSGRADHSSHVHAGFDSHAATVKVADAVQKFGYSAGGLENYGGMGQISSGHVSNSMHYAGLATDMSGKDRGGLDLLTASIANAFPKGSTGSWSNYMPGVTQSFIDRFRGKFLPLGGFDIKKMMSEAFAKMRVPDWKGSMKGTDVKLFQESTDALKTDLEQKVQAQFSSSSTGGMSFKGGGGPGEWIHRAMEATGAPNWWYPLLMRTMQAESGGDPNASAYTTVASGQRAQGLMQTIPSTFAAYSLGGSILDPVANAIASIRYRNAAYSGGDWSPYGPISPYHNGGVVGPKGRRLPLGESTIRVQEGETVLPRGGRGGGDTYINLGGINVKGSIYGIDDLEDVVNDAMTSAVGRRVPG